MMNRRVFAGSIAALSASTLLTQGAGAQTAGPVRNVVLVHGLFADGSSWGKVIPILQRAGLKVTSVQNPLTSFQEDVDAA